MKETVEGIVLNETNYSETSKILNILTKEHGYISVMAKGARTLKSKIRGISMKLVYASFTINYKETGMSNLIEGNVINSFKNIMSDLTKMNYALYSITLVKSVLKENNNPEIYNILKNVLIKINDGFDLTILTNILEVKLLNYLGVRPNLDECIKCFSKDILTFDITLGGLVCKKCYQDTYVFSPNTLKLLRLFQDVDIFKIDKINLSNKSIKKELELFIKEYYETYTGIYLLNKDKLHVLPIR